MALTKIAGAGVYYLEGAEVHGDIAVPVRGDLAIYTYAAAGEFIGKEYSYSGTAWFSRDQITETAGGSVAGLTVVDGITSWAGSGTGSAPTLNATRRMYGLDLDGIISSQLYFWNGTTWVTMTGITHLTFLGG